jgi:hypothetical protein
MSIRHKVKITCRARGTKVNLDWIEVQVDQSTKLFNITFLEKQRINGNDKKKISIRCNQMEVCPGSHVTWLISLTTFPLCSLKSETTARD